MRRDYREVGDELAAGTGDGWAGAAGWAGVAAGGGLGKYSGPRWPQPESTAAPSAAANQAAMRGSVRNGFTITITLYDIHWSVA